MIQHADTLNIEWDNIDIAWNVNRFFSVSLFRTLFLSFPLLIWCECKKSFLFLYKNNMCLVFSLFSHTTKEEKKGRKNHQINSFLWNVADWKSLHIYYIRILSHSFDVKEVTNCNIMWNFFFCQRCLWISRVFFCNDLQNDNIFILRFKINSHLTKKIVAQTYIQMYQL